ncbi:MAG: replicative DNA helicase [Pyrobaculum sp.]
MKQIQNLEAERSLITGILLYPDIAEDLLEIVSSKDFTDPACRYIMEAVESLIADSKPIDVITISDRLSEFGYLEKIGGFETLVSFTDGFAVAEHLKEYAQIVKEKSRQRSLLALASAIANYVYEDKSSEEILGKIESYVRRIEESMPLNDCLDISEALSRTIDQIEMIEQKRKAGLPVTGITTGYRELDQMLGGFHEGELVIIAARPSMGKTAFALNLAVEACKKGAAIAFFSLEMSLEQLMQRLLAVEALVPLHLIRNGLLSPEHWKRLNSAAERLFKTNFLLDDSSQLDTRALRSKLRRVKKDYSVQVAFIDYLQLMNSTKMLENRQQEISEISRNLKLIARDLGVTIVALSQLSRAVEQREDKRPRLSDLRESGAIEQDADVVMFLYRDEYYKRENVGAPHEIEVIIAKQRNGPIGTVTMMFNPETTKFFELSAVKEPV